MVRAKKVVIIKNQFVMPINHMKEFLKSVHTSDVILQFLAKASNGRRHSYFENWCLKLGTGTPEDILLTNFGVNLCKSIIGFVLLNTSSTQ